MTILPYNQDESLQSLRAEANRAKNFDGGVVNASEISVERLSWTSGTFVGEPVTPQWSDIQNIPNGFADGVDDDSDSLANISCADDGMILSYSGGQWDCGYDIFLDSADVIEIIESEVLDIQEGSTLAGVEL